MFNWINATCRHQCLASVWPAMHDYSSMLEFIVIFCNKMLKWNVDYCTSNVCIHPCTNIFTHTHTHTHKYAYTYHAQAHIHEHTSGRMHTHMPVHNTLVYICMYMYNRLYVSSHTQTPMRTNTHTHYALMHIHIRSWMFVSQKTVECCVL